MQFAQKQNLEYLVNEPTIKTNTTITNLNQIMTNAPNHEKVEVTAPVFIK